MSGPLGPGFGWWRLVAKARNGHKTITVEPQVALRPAYTSDQEQLLDLKRRASLAVPEDRDALLARPEVIDLPRQTLTPQTAVVALWDGEVAGFVTLSAVTDDAIEIEALFVAPEFWRQGIGRHLMAAAEELALSQGATRLLAVSGGFARSFYERCGFEPLGEASTLLGRAHRMRRGLDTARAG